MDSEGFLAPFWAYKDRESAAEVCAVHNCQLNSGVTVQTGRSLPESLHGCVAVVITCSLNRGRLLRHGRSGERECEVGEDVGREVALAEQWKFVVGY